MTLPCGGGFSVWPSPLSVWVFCVGPHVSCVGPLCVWVPCCVGPLCESPVWVPRPVIWHLLYSSIGDVSRSRGLTLHIRKMRVKLAVNPDGEAARATALLGVMLLHYFEFQSVPA